MRVFAMHVLLLTTYAATLQAAQWELTVSSIGNASLVKDGDSFASLVPGLFHEGWQGASLRGIPPKDPLPASAPRLGILTDHGGVTTDVSTQVIQADGTCRLIQKLTPREETKLNSLHVSMSIPEDRCKGTVFEADGTRGHFPDTLGEIHLYSKNTTSLKITFSDGEWLQWTFAVPTPVLLQDNRQWGPTFSVRIGPQMPDGTAWPAGKSLTLDYVFAVSGTLGLTLDSPVEIKEGKDWIPLHVELDIIPGSALDFSELVPWHRPAGKFGHVVATSEGKFVFESRPDEPVRFYGVNFCSSAQYLEKGEAEMLAERLMRLGYNTVRFHHHDGPAVIRQNGVSTELNPENMDKLDYLFAQLKARGIYATTDLYVSRRVFAGEIWPGEAGDIEMSEFKMLVPVNDAAYQNWKTFSRNFLTHVNPYTGMSYANDPALAWLSMINEGNVGNYIKGTSDRVAREWQRAWNNWLVERYHENSGLEKAWGKAPEGSLVDGTIPLAANVSLDTPRGRDFSLFLAETERAMFAKMKKFLRDEIGTRALLTNMNGWTNRTDTQLAREDYDYVDDHFYVDHPHFLEKRWRLPSSCPNTSPVAGGAMGGRHTAFTRIFGKPFTISEYNYSGPGRYRGVGGILTGCLAAIQDWSVVWRFAYSHSRNNVIAPSRAGYFDVSTDPLNLAAERASLCLFRRGDLAPAQNEAQIVLDLDAIEMATTGPRGLAPSWKALANVLQVGTRLCRNGSQAETPALQITPAETDGTADAIAPYGDGAGEAIETQLRNEGRIPTGELVQLSEKRTGVPSGQFRVNAPDDIMVLDTPCTAGGFAPQGATISAESVTVKIIETDATVWVSSLDGKPLPESRHLLVTHLTDLQNSGARFGESARKILLSWGKLPHLVRAGKAEIAIKTQGTNAQVHTLATSGRQTGSVEASVVNGCIHIPLQIAGPDGARILYEVVVD